MTRCLMKQFLICLVVWMAGCCATQPNTITQVSTIDAILAGAYDGQMTCEELLSYGDFGIGTFDRLDGEMILLNGKLYQVRYDGTVYSPPLGLTTPFASVVPFGGDITKEVQHGIDYHGLKAVVNEAAPNINTFCAVKVTGTFSAMQTRSVPPQDKPYPPLTEVTKHQPVFDLSSLSGTIVGFRSPPYVKGIGVPGYHLHFISDDGKSGGHILGFTVEKATAEIDICNRFFMILPEGETDFGRIDLSRDRSKDLERSER
ncbi:MAG: acetolactate decarboxylase [Thermodesulfobacteriota bacterium]|nr:acetolactate decarboxylase [Thermodesulfobacteriota bacterium]